MADRKFAQEIADEAEVDLITSFIGFCKGMSINQKDGTLTINIGVPEAEKYAAMPTTDHPGRVLHFIVLGEG